MKAKKSAVAFPFVLELLSSADYRVKPMFGCHALYIGEKLMLIMRNREEHTEANGVWLSTDFSHHDSLRELMPSLTSVYILSDGKKETSWQMIPLSADDFEESVTLACELILKNDPRIGKIPKSKKKRKI